MSWGQGQLCGLELGTLLLPETFLATVSLCFSQAFGSIWIDMGLFLE